MECTWKDCTKTAEYPQIAKDGEQWANLCKEHHKKLENSIGAEPKEMLSCWIKAMGGAKMATIRTLGGNEDG